MSLDSYIFDLDENVTRKSVSHKHLRDHARRWFGTERACGAATGPSAHSRACAPTASRARRHDARVLGGATVEIYGLR
jgi:hypothetical protein